MVLSEAERHEIVCGKFQRLPKLSSKIVRVFISSTFTDTQCERNYLMEHVYPKLRTVCQEKYGLAFQVVDMRWGIRDTAQDDHGTADLCLKEIEICTRLSIGPSFMCLLGQRYGFRPLPIKLSIEHFTVITNALKNQGKDVSQLEKWYIRDENNVPPVYQLRPISSVFPGFVNGGQERTDILEKQWSPTRDNLFNLLKEGVGICLENNELKPEECDEYFVSVTEQEIRAGVFDHPDADGSDICYIRRIENRDAILNHKHGRYYIDLNDEGELDEEASHLLEKLKTDALPEELSALNFIYCNTRFKGEQGIGETTHVKYLNDLGEKVHNAIVRLVELNLQGTDLIRDDLQMDEVIQHSLMCQKRCEGFKGRSETLRSMKLRLTAKKLVKRSSVLSTERQPWVLYGESGSGKTSLMAKCASKVKEWLQGTEAVVVIRFLGTSPFSCDIRQVLESVCQQICSAYSEEFQEQKDYDSLVTYFNTLLKLATDERPLYVFLDSIDQLSSSNNAYRLLWLPRSLPPACHMVLSLLPQKFDLLNTAKQVVNSNVQFVLVTSLESSVCYEVLQDWLKLCRRTNTAEQTEIIKQAFEQCSLPLYVRFVFDEVTKWNSHTPLEECRVETSVQGCIESLFDRLETKHGKTLVSHTLGYLTASKTGLSDAEMNDILSLDDEVLNEVFTHWLPPIRRIPGVLWSRICGDLDLYIVEREADGMSVVFWYHRQFIEVAKQRYLSDPEVRVYLYSNMADYYRGIWANGRRKPFAYSPNQIERFHLTESNSEADRLVPEQPLSFTSGEKIFYNLRKLNHLPRLLSLGQKEDVLKEEILFNFDWLHSKISATSVQNVIHDYSRLVGVRKEVKLILGALSMAGTSLNRNPNGLCTELLGRLLTKSIDERSDKAFVNFLADVVTKGEKQCALQPLHLSFDIPRSYQLYTLEGHKGHVVGMQFSPNCGSLFSVSLDGTIANWDLRGGERISLLDLGDLKLEIRTLLMFTKDGEFLICDTRTESSPLLVVDPAVSQFVHELGERLMPPFTNTTISSRFVCRNGVIYDVVHGKELGTLADIVSDREWAKVTLDPRDRYILVSSGCNVLVVDVLTFFVKGKLHGENKPSSILVHDDVCIVGYINETVLKLFSLGDGAEFCKCFNTLDYRECVEGEVFEPRSFYRKEVSDIDVSNDKRLYLANIQRCYLLVFDLELMNVTVMKSHEKEHGDDPSYFWANFSSDDKMVLAVSQKRYLILWDSSTGDNLAFAEVYNGLFDIRYLISSPTTNTAATYAVNDSTIRIWDLDKMRSEETTESDDSLIRYDNALTSQCLRVGGDYVFVRHFMPLIVERSFKYTSHFGIDAVHMPTGKKTVILPFERYGKPIDFDVSHHLKFLAFAVTIDESQLLYLLNLKQGTMSWVTTVVEEKVSEIRFSARDSHVIVSGQDCIGVYDCDKGIQSMFAENLISCRMDPSESYLIGIQSVDPSMRAKLVRVTAENVHTLSCDFSAVGVRFHPTESDHVLATTVEDADGACAVHVYDLSTEASVQKIEGVVGGIADVTANGLCFVDYGLNLFYFDGTRKQLGKDSSMNLRGSVVRITVTGKYVYWLDEENSSVHCIQVMGAKEIALCDLHSKPVGLRLFAKGYQIAIGCYDGRLVFLALHRDRKSTTLGKVMAAAGRPIEWLKEKASQPIVNPIGDSTVETLRTKFKTVRKPKLQMSVRRRRRSSSSDSNKLVSSFRSGGYSSDSDSSDSGGAGDRTLKYSLKSSLFISSSVAGVSSDAIQGSERKSSRTCSLI